MRLTLAFALIASVPAVAAERKVPFWPDAVPEAIHAAVDGGAALETVRELSRFHRVQGSPGFAGAAELVRRKAAAAGLRDASVERFPADGKTRYQRLPPWLAGTGVSRFAVPTCAVRCSSTTTTTSRSLLRPRVSRTSPFRTSRANPKTPS